MEEIEIVARMSELDNLNALSTRLDEVKRKIIDLKVVQIGLEEAIIEMIDNGKLEGVQTRKTDKFQIKITKKLTRKLDAKAYEMVKEGLPIEPVDYKPSINLEKLRVLDMIDESVSSLFITLTPAKTSITIKDV